MLHDFMQFGRTVSDLYSYISKSVLLGHMQVIFDCGMKKALSCLGDPQMTWSSSGPCISLCTHAYDSLWTLIKTILPLMSISN
jgi:hypothetical protein